MTKVHFEPGTKPEIVRVYHSRAPLTDLVEESVWRNATARTPLFNDVISIPGIAGLVGRAYSLIIEKSPAFDWEEIHPAIMKLLDANYGPMTASKELQ